MEEQSYIKQLTFLSSISSEVDRLEVTTEEYINVLSTLLASVLVDEYSDSSPEEIAEKFKNYVLKGIYKWKTETGVLDDKE